MSGVRHELLDRQAQATALPVIKVWIPPQCSHEVYENRMASTLAGPEFQGIDHVAFADLFLEDIRAYREGRLAQAGKRGVFPIWGRDTAVLAREIIANGFRAIVVCVDPRALDRTFAGRAFDEGFLADLPEGVDPCGENGEFHTFVHDGPCSARRFPAAPARSSPATASSTATSCLSNAEALGRGPLWSQTSQNVASTPKQHPDPSWEDAVRRVQLDRRRSSRGSTRHTKGQGHGRSDRQSDRQLRIGGAGRPAPIPLCYHRRRPATGRGAPCRVSSISSGPCPSCRRTTGGLC